MKKGLLIKGLLLMILIAIILACTIPYTLIYRSFRQGSPELLENLNIHATVNTDGSMDVVERWKVKINNLDHNSYKMFSRTYKPAMDSNVEDISAYDIDQKKEYEKSYITNSTYISDYNKNKFFNKKYFLGEYEIGVIFTPIKNGTKNFIVKYKVKGGTRRLSDYANLRHTFISEKSKKPIKNLNLTLTFPVGTNIKEDGLFYLYFYPNSTVTYDNPNQMTISSKNIRANVDLAIDAAFPSDLLPNMPLEEEYTLNKEYKQKNYDEWVANNSEKLTDEQKLQTIDLSITITLAILLILLILLLFLKKIKPHKINLPDYIREIPENSSPAQVAILYYYYNKHMNKNIAERMISATLMNLTNKGYLELNKNNKETVMKKSADQEGLEALAPSEKIILELVSSITQFTDGIFTNDIFVVYIQKFPKYFNKIIDRFFSEAQNECYNKGYYEAWEKWKVISLGCSICSFVTSVVLFTATPLVLTPIAVAIFSAFTLVISTLKVRLSKKGEYDYTYWKSIINYVEDFSNMKEYDLDQLKIWKDYLVYATVLGISTDVMKDLKLTFPQIDYFEETQHPWRFSYTKFGFYSSKLLRAISQNANHEYYNKSNKL